VGAQRNCGCVSTLWTHEVESSHPTRPMPGFRHHGSVPRAKLAELEVRVELYGTGIRVCDGNRILSPDDFISQLRFDARFADEFSPEPTRISRRDSAKLRDNFDQICNGTVVVE
jgi:hypothetical protein